VKARSFNYKAMVQYVTVDQCKAQSTIPFADDDELIGELINAAQERVEKDIQQPLTACLESDGTTLAYPLQRAIIIMVATLYSNREAVAYSQPYNVQYSYGWLITPYIKYT
jgi:uncharacterized phage protein (predicted DNA packaging)